MQKYEKPSMEIVDLTDDVILTSGGHNTCSNDSPIELPEQP